MSNLKSPALPFEHFERVARRYPGLDPLAIYLNNVISRFTREYVAAQDRELARYGLATSRHFALGVISARGEAGISPAELAEVLGITRGGLTGLIDGLEDAGLIVRETYPGDRRMVRLVVTAAGLRKQDEYWPTHGEAIGRFLGVLTVDEKRQLVALLQKAAGGLEHLNAPD